MLSRNRMTMQHAYYVAYRLLSLQFCYVLIKITLFFNIQFLVLSLSSEALLYNKGFIQRVLAIDCILLTELWTESDRGLKY